MAKKSESLMIRVSPEVKQILSEKASVLGMSMSEYARLLILEDARKSLTAPDNEASTANAQI